MTLFSSGRQLLLLSLAGLEWLLAPRCRGSGMWLSFFFLSFGFPHSATSPPLLSNEHIRHEQVRQEILNNAQLSAQIASVPAFLFLFLSLSLSLLLS